MAKLAQGERTEGIEQDPLENTDPDYTYDYNVVPGYLKRELSISGEDKIHIQPHAKSIQHVEAMMEKFKKKRQENEENAIQEVEENEVQPVEEEKQQVE